MKILIAGDGKVGATLTRQLSSEGYEITLIDSNQKVLEYSMEQYDVMTVYGNCASKNILLQAKADEADLLIAATSADEINLLCCMTAHGINPKLHTIARIRNPEYSDQIYEMRDIFALSMSINPEKQAAAEIERLLKYPGFLKRDTFAKGKVEIVELRIDSESKLRDVSLSNMYSIVRCKVLVCVVLRNGEAIAPDGNFILKEGDRIFVTAPSDVLATLLDNLGIISRKVKRVLICGGGRISYYLASLLAKNKVSVSIIESNPERCVELAGLLPDVTIINGDASSQQLLESEGLSKCDAVVSMTGLDELNMVISLYANIRQIPQIITKISRVENNNILNNLPVGSLICPKELCCNNIVRYVRAMQNQSGAAVAVHFIADGNAEAVEFRVDDSTLNCGKLLKNIRLRKNVLIVCITHGGNTEIPNGNSSYEIGDTLIVVTNGITSIRRLNDIFQ